MYVCLEMCRWNWGDIRFALCVRGGVSILFSCCFSLSLSLSLHLSAAAPCCTQLPSDGVAYFCILINSLNAEASTGFQTHTHTHTHTHTYTHTHTHTHTDT